MTTRISDERLAELIAEQRRIVELAGCKGDLEVTIAIEEALQSRARDTALRALLAEDRNGEPLTPGNLRMGVRDILEAHGGAAAPETQTQNPLERMITPGSAFVLARDDDAHWYLIKETEQERFNRWVAATSTDSGGLPEDWRHFEKCRIDGPDSIRFFEPACRYL